ncbi:MAG: hypothetical protein WC582_00870 [Patescibacteria group bacterium]
MAFLERIELYKQIEINRGNPLIVYVTSQRQGALASMAGDVINELIDQVRAIEITPETSVDLLIESFGGDPLVSWRIISLLRSLFQKVNVIVPHSAFSAATLLALGADEIVMGSYGSLGPIDPQITTKRKDGTTQEFGYEDVVSFLSFVREEGGITEQQYIKGAFEKLCEVVEPPVLGFAKRSSSLSISIGEKMLQMHMTDPEEKTQAHTIAMKLNKSFFSHGHALGRKEAEEIGLNVIAPNADLEKLIWDVHTDFELELQTRTPFDPVAEYLKDPLAAPLLQSPPPFSIPPQIANNQQVLLQLLQNYINQQSNVALPNIEVELKHAFVESQRVSSECYAKGRILIQRTLDMRLNSNVIFLDRGWHKVEIPTAVETSISETTTPPSVSAPAQEPVVASI